MRPSEALEAHRAALRAMATRHRVQNMRVFGSVLNAGDTERSDLDLLVDPTPQTTLMDIAALQVEAEHMLGVRVDVLTPQSLPAAFRERVVREAVPV
ncbi:MAG TPA: nucleotidyltransferase family protein [Chloroflexota bacterium]|nr:nucleotidyltransferase family protein [Chloroflexota bacterium]